jgi:hypothetical protein
VETLLLAMAVAQMTARVRVPAAGREGEPSENRRGCGGRSGGGPERWGIKERI